MSFYKNRKVGRPTDEEQMMIYSIEKIIDQKGIPMDEIPECHTLEDLIEVKTLLESYTPQEQNQKIEDFPISELNSQEEDKQEQQYSEDETEQDIVSDWIDKTDQISEIEKNQARESTTNTADTEKIEKSQFINDNYDPFSEPLIERSYTQAQTGQQVQEDSEDEEPLELEDSKTNPHLEDLNPVTKRKAAEQTANALLKGYARLVPQPFKWMSKLPEEKIEKMAFNGELDLTIEVSDGMTFEDYMRQTNEQLDEIFEVQDETLDEIKEPLIEVLMEQQLELTATQRLTMAIISHLAQMFTVALKLRQQNNRILSYQKHLTYLSRVKSA